MTTLTTRLTEATEPTRELDAEIFIAAVWPDWRIQTDCENFPDEVREGRIQEPNGCGWRSAPAYTASIDAAMTLVPEGVGGERLHIRIEERYTGTGFCLLLDTLGGQDYVGEAATPALALAIACLKARGL